MPRPLEFTASVAKYANGRFHMSIPEAAGFAMRAVSEHWMPEVREGNILAFRPTDGETRITKHPTGLKLQSKDDGSFALEFSQWVHPDAWACIAGSFRKLEVRCQLYRVTGVVQVHGPSVAQRLRSEIGRGMDRLARMRVEGRRIPAVASAQLELPLDSTVRG